MASRVAIGVAAVAAALAVLTLPSAFAAVIVGALVLAAAALAAPPEETPGGGVLPTTPPIDDLRPLVAMLGGGVLALGGDNTVLLANPAAARIVDRPLDSMVGASLIQAVRDHDLAQVAREASGQPVDVHLSSAGRDVIATGTLVDLHGIHTILVMEDVTELLRAQRARTELVANVSHELRTPIAAARALAETLEAGVQEPEERERFLGQLVREIERLGTIVQRLLWLARVESGAETFSPQRLDCAALLTEAASRMAPVAGHYGVHIDVTPGPGAENVLGDRERVLEVLSNLVDNAIRHSPEGERICLSSTREPAFVRIEVSDHGPGIPPNDRERVFERFYTGDRARGRQGSGLGLAIARHIVQRLGGRIWIEDRSEPGAVIAFTLPVASPDMAEAV